MPKDSTRLSISGCANGRVFTVGRDPEHESSFVMELGTKLRLEGDKKVLADIKAHEGSMVEVTGPDEAVGRGPAWCGSRRWPGAHHTGHAEQPHRRTRPRAVAAPMLDVESYRLLNASCPKR